MPNLTVSEAFRRYDVTLRNVQWSVCGMSPEGELVVSIWSHHRRTSAPGTMEFADSFNRWSGPGNAEFRKLVAAAFAAKTAVRLVIVHTDEQEKVQSGVDASTIKKSFDPRIELIGDVIECDESTYAFRFVKSN